MGSAGGRKLFELKGRDYFVELGKRGAARFYELYHWQPYSTSQFALVSKKTGQIVAFSDGRPVERREIEA